jgi:Ca2+-binding EF-hand superfamily protein
MGGAFSTTERNHDRKHDGLLDLVEAERLASANDVAAGAFRLENEGRSGQIDASQSAAWLLIDTDEDRVLSSEELAAAAARLKARDADDNDLLEPSELSPSPAAQVEIERPAAGSVYHGPPRVVQLGPRGRWDSLVSALVETYQEDERIVVARYPLAVPLLAAVDKNKDGKIDRDEVRGLNQAPPHVTIAVSFGKPSSVRVVETSKLVGPVEVKGSDARDTVLRFPQLDVELRINDQAFGGLGEGEGANPLKAQFDAVDGDKNAYLDGDEYIPAGTQLRVGFSDADKDGNGKITFEEFETLASRELMFVLSTLRARPADADDNGWSVLDRDADARLSLREIRTAAERLKSFDQDADGRLTGAEMPRTLIVRLERGVQAGPMGEAVRAGMQMSAPRVRPAGGPPWFDRMDSNSDGDISPREFLGTPEQFAALDADKDGLISRAEAQDAEKTAEKTAAIDRGKE